MQLIKRIFLFLALNLVIITTISIILSLFNVQPYLNQAGLDYTQLLIFCLIWGMGGAFISLLLSRKMAKWFMGVKLIDPENASGDAKALYETVKRLSKKAHLPCVPEVGIFPSMQVNAFATGPTKKRSLVAVSKGLLEKMDEAQIEAILGHEISHIKHGDMVTMTLLQGVVNAFVMFLARVLAFALSATSKGDSKRSSYGSYYLLVIVFQIVFMILGTMVICAYSRWREFKADKGGAKLSTKKNMIEALEGLKHQRPAKIAESMHAMMISMPGKKGFFNLFATHPPLDERIDRLKG